MTIIQPYKHDCNNCKWMGWVTVDGKLGNMYLCETPTIITVVIRWSDDGPDYGSYSIFKDSNPEPTSIAIM